MKRTLNKRFWLSMLIFSLVGQVAWVVENMYLNVFIYKMFRSSAGDISLMVGASSVAAAVTTLLVGALSDKVGRRKLFVCGGYVLWGVTIAGFSLVRLELLTPLAGSTASACSLGITLVILLDCVMTFFGSAANDAAFNAWLTDWGREGGRGKIEGLNSIMPLLSILVVFGGFMGFDLDRAESWNTIFLIIGGVVLLIGVLGLFLMEESPAASRAGACCGPYWNTVTHSFRPRVYRENRLLYWVLGAFALFGVSIQTFMPYLIVYYEQSLGMENYVLVMAPAILIAAVITALYGRVYDMQGFKGSIIPVVAILMVSYVILFFSRATLPVFLGSVLMMTGHMNGMSMFAAMIRDNIPENRAGQFQGVRIIGQVLIPGIVGPAIGAWILRDAELIVNNDGTSSFLPHRGIWVAAFVTGLLLCAALALIFHMVRISHHTLWSEAGQAVRDGAPCWQEHPRPQFKRERWHSLNGQWQLNGAPICIPFPPQAPLSGYRGRVGTKLTYETEFSFPAHFDQNRVLLHFGAVDQVARVELNGVELGCHEGGYLPFAFEITDHLHKDRPNRLVVRAEDPLSLDYPYGKQCKKRGGMWYTPVSGIWQSVWLENVPERYIQNLTITPDLTGVDLTAEGCLDGFSATVELGDGQTLSRTFSGPSGRLEIPSPILWTPDSPHLYSITVTAGVDRVESYFALRTMDIREVDGVQRVCLNGRPIFLHGVLDQGYFCDGLFLPAQEDEYERDILRMKDLGYNLLRKHIKVEPECFYHACDRLGMLVMQDMVNSGPYHFLRETALPTFGFKTAKDTTGMTGKRKEFFLTHSRDTIRHLYNHPCIVAYTIFNEGWGQFHSDEVFRMVKGWDPTRLVDATSGWFAQQENDFDSEHIYFKATPLTPGKRPLFVSECGGYSMLSPGHCYSKYAQYGYGTCDSPQQLTRQIEEMYRVMILPAIPNGLCGCIYTQLSDVEDEINGLYTYDRRRCKVEPKPMQRLAKELNRALDFSASIR